MTTKTQKRTKNVVLVAECAYNSQNTHIALVLPLIALHNWRLTPIVSFPLKQFIQKDTNK